MENTEKIITGKNYFVYQVIFNDDTVTQYASIYDSAKRHPGKCDGKKGTQAIELISLGFATQKDIKKYFPKHHIHIFNHGDRISRELRLN